jgi:hypothetical protein
MQDIQALGKAFSHQPSKEIIQHFFKNDIYCFFLFSWVIFALLDGPDPGT